MNNYRISVWVCLCINGFENCYQKSNYCNRKAKTQFEICLRTRKLLHPQHVFNSNHFMKLYLLVHPNQDQEEYGTCYAQGGGQRSFL
jgi:hypothetical protein